MCHLDERRDIIPFLKKRYLLTFNETPFFLNSLLQQYLNSKWLSNCDFIIFVFWDDVTVECLHHRFKCLFLFLVSEETFL